MYECMYVCVYMINLEKYDIDVSLIYHRKVIGGEVREQGLMKEFVGHAKNSIEFVSRSEDNTKVLNIQYY